MKYSALLIIIAFFCSSMGCSTSKNLQRNPPYTISWSDDPVWGEAVSFYSDAPITSTYLWDFGNGRTSTLMQPKYTYGKAGNYTISLTLDHKKRKKISKQIHIGNMPVYRFYTIATNTDTVQFTSIADSGSSYHWDFGDDSTSTLPNPAHLFAQPGVYNITLKVNNRTAFCNNPVLHVAQDPLYTFKISGTRMFYGSTNITIAEKNTITPVSNAAYTIGYTDKLTLLTPKFSGQFFSEPVMYNPIFSAGNILTYTSANTTLRYDTRADTVYIEQHYVQVPDKDTIRAFNTAHTAK
ncbi:MAG: PKD domain-containing protein [Bacteroidetes bacterium]|nr:PKD domain-containing protein [Bacteroidota bacterium]